MRTRILSRALLWGVMVLPAGSLASCWDVFFCPLSGCLAAAQVPDLFATDELLLPQARPAADDPFRPGAPIPPTWRRGKPEAVDPFAIQVDAKLTAEENAARQCLAEKEQRERIDKSITFIEGEIPTPLTNEQAQQKLQAETKVNFLDVPLSQALEELEKTHEIPIQLGIDSFEEVSRGTVTLKVSKVSLESALQLILEPLNLDFTLEDGVLFIATLEYLETHLDTQVCPVRDLIQCKSGAEVEEDAESLIELIEGTVQPSSWDQVGGKGTIEAFDGQLIVSQTRAVHREVKQLLAALREFPALDSPELGKKLAGVVFRPDPQTAQVIEALEAPLKVEFDGTPLNEIVEPLRKQNGINVVFDLRSFAEIDMDIDTRIRMHGPRIRLGTALRLALRDLGLDYVVAHGVLQITSKDRAAEKQVSIAYPVMDLLSLPAEPAHGDILVSLTSLKSTIESSLEPNSWNSVGGAGVLHPYVNRGMLLISNDQQVHVRIVELLAKMRAAKTAQPVRPQSAFVLENQMLMIGYELIYEPPAQNEQGELIGKAVERADTQKLSEVIQSVVAPESWRTNKEAYIRALPDRLVVRHEKHVQREIEILLNQLGLQFLSGAPGEAAVFRVKGGRYITHQQQRLLGIAGSGSGIFNVPER